MGIGIEKIGVYPCALSLEIATLCEARGLDAANFCGRLFCEQRSVMGPFEDVITLGVNAAMPMLTAADRDAIRLLIVATESSPDQEKPVSSWVHHFLGLRSDCRNFEVKHACYGATGAVQVAIGWLMSSVDPGAKVLIINADHALIGLDGPQEPVLGAAGLALLLSNNPRIVEFDAGWNGVYAHEVADIFRPAPGVETGDADESLLSYLDAVELTYDAYVARVGQAVDFDTFFAANVYHVPFGGLAQRAHFRLARREMGLSKSEAERHWDKKSKSSLTYNRRTGGVYGAATFVALAGLVDSHAVADRPAIALASTVTDRGRAPSSIARRLARMRAWPWPRHVSISNLPIDATSPSKNTKPASARSSRRPAPGTIRHRPI